MGKNITLREGDTSKQFTADKIKTNLVGGGTCNWIPEDEAVDYVDLKDHTFTQAGTFNPSDFNCDGFRQVKIDIPADVKEKTITANGEYYAADDNCLGYNKVTVAVPGGGGGGPFTVRFFGDDRQTIIKTQADVPYGGNASCTLLDGTTLNGQYFKGWNPSPMNVRENMNCYPVRGDYQYDANEITDDWETICADGGAHYPLGSYKALVITDEINIKSGDLIVPYHPVTGLGNCVINNVNNFISCQFHMVKVAEGEDGSSSTWLSTGNVTISGNPNTRFIDVNGNMSQDSQYPDLRVLFMTRRYTTRYAYDWAISGMKYILDQYLFPHLPQALQNSIKTVNKTYKGFPAYGTNDYTPVDKTSLDKIWVPSRKEMHTLFTTYSIDSGLISAGEEETGIDYTMVYVPTYTKPYRVRTIPRGGNGDAWNFYQTVKANNSVGGCNNIDGNSGQNNFNFPIGFCL